MAGTGGECSERRRSLACDTGVPRLAAWLTAAQPMFAPAPTHPSELGAAQRAASLRWLAGHTVDVLVVGGGITGAGCALDAASRNLSVALLEQRDFASGTSSRSSKLIHGGLRYLEQMRFGLVAESLAERTLLVNHTAPHLVQPMPFVLPLIGGDGQPLSAAGALVRRAYVGAGIGLYSALAAVSERVAGRRLRRSARPLARSRHLSAAQVGAIAPTLADRANRGGVLFFDASVDDARHTLAVARTAASYGAHVLSSLRVTELLTDGDEVCGALAVDVETGAQVTVRARCVVNATGVWTDDVAAMAPSARRVPSHSTLRTSKGVHLVLGAERLKLRAGLIVPTPSSVLFVIPWGTQRRYVIVGTTDTPYRLSRAHPAASRDDIEYLLARLNAVLREPVSVADIRGVYAGLRPLVAGDSAETTKLSRTHQVTHTAKGLVSVAGGKYTTYRAMARDAIDAAVRDASLAAPGSRTADVVLVGSRRYGQLGAAAAEQLVGELATPEANETLLRHLVARYGDQAGAVLDVTAHDPALAEPLVPGHAYVRAEVVYTARAEGALHLDDVLTRRTRLSIESPDRALGAAAPAAQLMAAELGWSDERAATEVARYAARVEAERASQAAASDEAADALRLAAPDSRAGLGGG